MFSRVFTVAEIDAVEDKEPGDTTAVDVQTLFVAFLHMPLKSVCLNDETSFWQKAKLPILALL